jgi:hypothetical protein
MSAFSYAADAPLNPVTTDLPIAKSQDAVVAGEIAMLDNLIEVTKVNLDVQKKLREQIGDYQKLLALYLKNENDKELLFRLVRVATSVSNTVKENHLTQIFDQEFLSEINVFAQIGNKRGIPKP